jgi:putative chitinase
VRAVVGLKKLKDQAQATSQSMMDLFTASRFVVSLIIGFVAGMIAGISIGFANLQTINPDNIQMLLGIAAAGYAGTDFIEAFASNNRKSSDTVGGSLGFATNRIATDDIVTGETNATVDIVRCFRGCTGKLRSAVTPY